MRTGDGPPSPEEVREALREIARILRTSTHRRNHHQLVDGLVAGCMVFALTALIVQAVQWVDWAALLGE